MYGRIVYKQRRRNGIKINHFLITEFLEKRERNMPDTIHVAVEQIMMSEKEFYF